MDKQSLIQSILDAPDSEKMELINRHFDLLSAKEIEDLSIRIISDLQASLEHHEKRASQHFVRKHPTTHQAEVMATSALISPGLGAQERTSDDVVAAAEEGRGPGEEEATPIVPDAFLVAEDQQALPLLLPDGHQVRRSPLQKLFRRKSRDESALSYGEGAPEVVSARSDALHRVATWAAAAAAVNTISVMALSSLFGQTIASAAPLVIWVLFAWLGVRHREAAGALVVTMLTFFYHGWSLLPLGIPVEVDTTLFTLAIVVAAITTMLWPLHKKSAGNDRSMLTRRI